MKAKNLATAAAEHRTDVRRDAARVHPREAADYHSQAETLSTCSILGMKANAVHLLEEAAAEHVYQLNHVYVPSPAAGREVLLENRLFVVFGCWDFSKKIQVGFRAKAILSLAQQESSESAAYVDALNANEIKHPVLASLRVRVKKAEAADDSHANTLVVEAAPA